MHKVQLQGVQSNVGPVPPGGQPVPGTTAQVNAARRVVKSSKSNLNLTWLNHGSKSTIKLIVPGRTEHSVSTLQYRCNKCELQPLKVSKSTVLFSEAVELT